MKHTVLLIVSVAAWAVSFMLAAMSTLVPHVWPEIRAWGAVAVAVAATSTLARIIQRAHDETVQDVRALLAMQQQQDGPRPLR